MAKPSSTQLEDAATMAINRAMTARDASEGVKAAVAASATAQALDDTVQRCIDAHAETITAANALSALVGQGNPDATGAASRLLDAANAAKTAANALKNNQTQATTDALAAADKDVVEKADNARAVLRSQKKARGVWAEFFSTLWNLLGSIGPIASTAVLVVGLYALLTPLFHQHDLLDRIANVEYARGLLTYIIGLATVVIALMLALGALLGSEAQKDNFNHGKEV